MKLLHIGALDGDRVHDARLAAPEIASRLDKPIGDYVLWASPIGSDYGWIDWAQDESWYTGGPSAQPQWELQLADDAKLLRIDALADLVATIDRYPVAPHRSRLAAIIQEIDIRRTTIDWLAVAVDYDGMWLTVAGLAATRFSEPSLYGWDCETVVVFRASAISDARQVAHASAS